MSHQATPNELSRILDEFLNKFDEKEQRTIYRLLKSRWFRQSIRNKRPIRVSSTFGGIMIVYESNLALSPKEKSTDDTHISPEFRSWLYETAREYWRENEMQERLDLSDDELDRRFSHIDENGIPVLKSDPDASKPLSDEDIIGSLNTDREDLSMLASLVRFVDDESSS